MRYLLDNDVFFAALYARHVNHSVARRWLDRAKPAGWGIAAETYLSAVRLLMNPAVMKSGQLSAAQAIEAVEAELGGRQPGEIVMARKRPDRKLLAQAGGHKLVMDLWLIQIAEENGCKLATGDAALAMHRPASVVRID